MIAVIGAGAMGAALAMLHARAGMPVTLLGTSFDAETVEACASGHPHPALGMVLDPAISCRGHEDWSEVLPDADGVVVAVSSEGLAGVVGEVARPVGEDVTWLVATKGWDQETLRTPSEVVGSVVGDVQRVVVLAGPALAPELAAGGPATLVCASRGGEAARDVAATLAGAGVSIDVTDDVVAVEVCAAYKNVTAIGVGMCEGLGQRQPEHVYAHRYANARAAFFALGLEDMARLAAPGGGRPETILGLAGAGDLYVTCLGGRNGTFGRLLGLGETPDQALATIGSTVEGVSNSRAALALAEQLGVGVVVARAVDAVLSAKLAPEEAARRALSSQGS